MIKAVELYYSAMERIATAIVLRMRRTDRDEPDDVTIARTAGFLACFIPMVAWAALEAIYRMM